MSRPWMPLYIADYLADTTHLRALDSGAYLHLIMHYWQHAGLPGDDRKLSAIAKLSDREWARLKPTLAEFFQNGWHHKRIDAELAKAADISSKRSASAKQKRNNSSANAEQLDTHARASSPSPSPKEDAADAAPDPEKELFARGKEVLGNDAGGLIAKLLKAKNKNVVLARAVIDTASQKQDPREYVSAVIRGPKNGEFKLMSGIEGVI